jgi:hypothetical protein
MLESIKVFWNSLDSSTLVENRDLTLFLELNSIANDLSPKYLILYSLYVFPKALNETAQVKSYSLAFSARTLFRFQLFPWTLQRDWSI